MDLERIESKMGEVTKADYPFVREVVDRESANRRFADDPLKLERISELGDDETITVYTDGPFTESKEHLGGFTVIEAADHEAALEWGAKLAKAITLPIEVRPLQSAPEG